MASSKALIDELKKVLRQRRVTYFELAKMLEISEASVKRIFSKYHCSLERLDSICDAIGIDVIELARVASVSKNLISHLSEQQEQELVKNEKLLLVAVCVRNHWTFEEIINHYQLTEPECISLLAQLDRLKFLELLPNNRIKLLVSTEFRWLANGPVEKYYSKHVENDFFNYQFKGNYEEKIFISGGLSEQSSLILCKKIKALAKEFHELHQQDFSEALSEKSNHAMVLAFRPWELQSFKQIKKKTR